MPTTVTTVDAVEVGGMGIGTTDLAIAAVVLVGGLILGYLVRRLIVRVGSSTGVDDFVEGTTFERVAESLGTSTVGVVATTIQLFVYVSVVVIALETLDFDVLDQGLVAQATGFIPNLVIAFLILVFGAILADKAAVMASERLEGVNVSDLWVIPTVVRYSVVFVAALMALSQLGVSTTALNILLGAYLVAAIVVGVVALRVVLPSLVSGVYILATQPYGVGDTVRIGEVEGIVQDVDLLTTRVASDEREYVVPNSEVFERGVSKEI